MLISVYVELKIPVFFSWEMKNFLTHVVVVLILVLIFSGFILMNVAQTAVKRSPVPPCAQEGMQNS